MNSTGKRARKADAPRPVEARAASVSPQASCQDELHMMPLSLNNLLENELPAEQSGSVSPTWSFLSSLNGCENTDGTVEAAKENPVALGDQIELN